MKKTIKWVGIINLAVIIIVFAVKYWATKDYYKPGENNEIKCAVDGTFKIELHENGSTGYLNCWINEQNFKHVKFIGKEYQSSLNETFHYIGAGGTTIYSFKGISIGTDTLKVAACPTARERKKCSDFNDKNTNVDNTFIVTIE